MSGAEFAKRMKAKHPKIPFIILSGVNELPPDGVTADQFLSKLSGPTAVFEAINAALNRLHFPDPENSYCVGCFSAYNQAMKARTPGRPLLSSNASSASYTTPMPPAADLAENAVMGHRLPHGLGRSGHWRQWYGEAWMGSMLSS
jgi:hypothetical protein